MRQSALNVQSVDFVGLDVKVKTLLDPEVQAEGAITGNVIHFPEVNSGFDALIFQKTADIADSGALAGKVQESADGITYNDLQAFASAGANAFEQIQIRITLPFLKYVGTATGGGMGTVEATAGIVF